MRKVTEKNSKWIQETFEVWRKLKKIAKVFEKTSEQIPEIFRAYSNRIWKTFAANNKVSKSIF